MTMDDELGSRHADFRLMQRAHELDKSLTEIWDESVPCEVKYHGYDEARVSPEYGIVLLKEDGQIVTCLNNTAHVTIDGDDAPEYIEQALGVEPNESPDRKT